MRTKPWLGTPAGTAEILRKHGIRAQKKYGQNFLVEPQILEGIVRAAEITEETSVLEIGPGIGTLTQYLAYAAGSVKAVEIDRSLLPVLAETLADWDNVEIIQGDILKLDLREILSFGGAGERAKVVANLPYYVTTPILMELLERDLPIDSVTVMVQKEVADRMLAAPGTPDYGALSLAVQYRCEPSVEFTVPPSCFIPRPAVTSAVVRLRVRKERLPVKDEKLLFRVVRAAFGQRRKTLENALGNSAELACGKEQARRAIASCGFPEKIRGEALSLEEFALLADTLSEGQ